VIGLPVGNIDTRAARRRHCGLHSLLEGGFHEGCTLMVGRRIVEAVAPRWLRIGGYCHQRGSIPIDVFWQTAAPPEGIWLPDQGVPSYRGR
jgi:7-cyano-7-deazaguanine reductase